MIGQLFRLTLRGIADFMLHPVAQLLTLVAVAMVTLLTGLILTGIFNVNLELAKSRGEVEFQVYWKTGLNGEAVRKDWGVVQAMPHLDEFKTYTPESALKELADTMGEGGDFSWLEENNPLPYSALASFKVPPEAQKQGWANALLTDLRSLPGVDQVDYTPFQGDLAQGWTTIAKAVIWPVLGFLGLVVSLVVHNTIKLSLMTRMDEVEILSLVGARPSYIRWPLLTGGFIQGLLGSLGGIGLLYAVHAFTADALNFPPFMLQIHFLPLSQLAMLAGGVTLVSMASSWVAVK
ncbi:FtsX-like permease family protein [Pseudodesulfovibrio cashew]|uniref:Cell division protein FtsX n=1 Tax=Pseudodesulfovibrio cashew TaxID=2678688 RepID=A0A6I6JBE4_9BACT|nr:permease-like cell division protein FtsX [Pseudodesulfovibrio cashew]QGY39391.1 FtsX-like permease family protein [Pseudodesulfovibrio cashew]